MVKRLSDGHRGRCGTALLAIPDRFRRDAFPLAFPERRKTPGRRSRIRSRIDANPQVGVPGSVPGLTQIPRWWFRIRTLGLRRHELRFGPDRHGCRPTARTSQDHYAGERVGCGASAPADAPATRDTHRAAQPTGPPTAGTTDGPPTAPRSYGATARDGSRGTTTRNTSGRPWSTSSTTHHRSISPLVVTHANAPDPYPSDTPMQVPLRGTCPRPVPTRGGRKGPVENRCQETRPARPIDHVRSRRASRGGASPHPPTMETPGDCNDHPELAE